MKEKSPEARKPTATIVVVVVLLVIAFAILVLVFREGGRVKPFATSGNSLVMPIDKVVPDMIAGFDGFTFSVTNGAHVVTIGRVVAKRVSAVDGRVRVNFDAVAIGNAESAQWNTSVLLEFPLACDGARLKAGEIGVRRIHVYGLPKDFGEDELEHNDAIVARIKGIVRPSRELVTGTERIVDAKLTVDDNIRIVTGGSL